MSTRARAVNLAIAAVIAIVAVVVILAGSGDDEPERQATATPVATRAQEQARRESTPKPEPTPQPVPVVRYRAGAVVGGVQTIEVDQGDRVRFDVVSDVEEEIHVHAYDLYYDLDPGKPAQVSFDADITGVIEVELHGVGAPLAELRVNP